MPGVMLPGGPRPASRRSFLQQVGQLAAFGWLGLLAACQGQPQAGPATSAPPSGPSQAPPTAGPAVPSPAVPGPPLAAGPSPAPAASAGAVPSPAAPSPAAARPSPPVAASAAVAGRPMYQQDAQHTGRSPHAGPRRAVLVRSFDTATVPIPDGGPAPRTDIQSSAAIGPDGTIYLGNFPGNLLALRDPGSGDKLELLWRFHPPGASSRHATPAVGPGGIVYLGFGSGFQPPSVQGTFYALKAPAAGSDGQVVWSVDLGPGAPTSSPTVAADGTIYMTQGDGTLFAIGPDGTARWKVKTGPPLTAAPGIGPDGTVYLASMDGNLYAVAPPSSGNQGAVKWTFDFGAHLGPTPLVTNPTTAAFSNGSNGIGSGASPTIAPDGMIYIGANNSNFYAIRPDGTLAWLFEAQRELAGIWPAAVLSADNSTLYFGANRGGIYALNRADGALRWRFDVYGSIYGSLALDSRGTLYGGSSVGHVYALEAASGEPIFDYDAGRPVWSAPAISPNGTLVVADRGGRVLVLGEG